MEDTQNFDSIFTNPVGQDIWEPADDQFPGACNTPGATHAGVSRERFSTGTNMANKFRCCFWAVFGNVCSFMVEVFRAWRSHLTFIFPHDGIHFRIGCKITCIRLLDCLLNFPDLPCFKIKILSNGFSGQVRLAAVSRFCQLIQLISHLRWNAQGYRRRIHKEYLVLVCIHRNPSTPHEASSAWG